MGADIRMFGFSTGEVSPSIKFRSDIDKYLGSCRKLKNFDVDVTGAIVRRRGLSFACESGSFPGASSKEFFYSGNFCGEDLFILFSLSDANVLSASFCRINSASPVFEAVEPERLVLADYDLFDPASVRFRQYNDVLLFCGRGLSMGEFRVSVPAGETSIGVVFRAFRFTIPPTLNVVSVDGGSFAVEGNELTLPDLSVASLDDKVPLEFIHRSWHVMLEDTSGESHYIDWGTWDKDGAKDGAKSAGAVSEVYYASGNTTLYFFSSGGRWCGQLALEVSYDPPSVADEKCSWIQVGSITGATDGALSPAVTFKVNHYNARVRIKLLERSAAYHYYYEEQYGEGAASNKSNSYIADMGCKWTLRISGDRRYYFEKGPSQAGASSFGVTRMNVAPKRLSCSRYTVGAFSYDLGTYPLTLDIAQQRLWLFSTDLHPKYFWASKIDDIANFSTGSEKTDGLSFEGDSGIPDVGRWMKFGKGQFQFGCSQSEGNLVGRDNEYSLNPTSLALENESAWGSADADAVLLGDKIFYIKAGRKIIHAQVYDSGRARFVSGEVNVLARHLFPVGKRAMKLVGVRAPESALFVLREDGTVARFVFNDEQNVGAWSWYDFSVQGMRAVDIAVLQGSEADRLVLMFKVENADGYSYRFGVLDPLSDVWTDFGVDYESEMISSGLPLDEQQSYGSRCIVSKLDLYGSSDVLDRVTDLSKHEFEVSFDGGAVYHLQRAGTSVPGSNDSSGLFNTVASPRRISWSGNYSNEASIGVRTSMRGAFELLAIGAHIVRTDTAAPKPRDKNGNVIF